MVLNLKFQELLPDGTDALYVYVPGLIDAFYFRSDWRNANFITAAALSYLGKKGHALRNETGGTEQVVVTCRLFDFIFEPFPTFGLSNLAETPEPEPEPATGKIIQMDQLIYKRRAGSRTH